MRTDAEHLTDGDTGEEPSFAGHLLLAERVVMGLVLLGFGISGVLNLVPDSSLPARAAAVSGALLQVGFAYPLLKGTEVLLELYVGRARRKERAVTHAAPARVPTSRLPHQPRRRRWVAAKRRLPVSATAHPKRLALQAGLRIPSAAR